MHSCEYVSGWGMGHSGMERSSVIEGMWFFQNSKRENSISKGLLG
jgi:hypothetical protein